MNQQPLISIIIPTLNREQYIKKAIDSALNQTYKNIEIIIVDGSLNDKTKKVVKSYLADARIHYIHEKEIYTDYRKERNESGARNTGIKTAKGKYIANLDDDDEWCDEKKLEKQVQFLENHPGYVVCGGGAMIVREKDSKKFFSFAPLPPEKDEDIRKEMLLSSIHAHSNLFFRKDTWEAVGGYDEELPFCTDFDFGAKLGKVGKLYNFQEYFTYLQQGEQNKPNRGKYLRDILRTNIYLVKKYRKDYPNKFFEAVLLRWLNYFYSFLPFGESLRPIVAKIKHTILDPLFDKINK